MNGFCSPSTICGDHPSEPSVDDNVDELDCKSGICKAKDNKPCENSEDCFNYPNTVCVGSTGSKTCKVGANMGDFCGNDKLCVDSKDFGANLGCFTISDGSNCGGSETEAGENCKCRVKTNSPGCGDDDTGSNC